MQDVREREAEEAGGNILKADSEKSLEVTEEKRGDYGNFIQCARVKY